jgi:hypothetical protein
VALHAALVLRGKFRQDVSVFVTSAALLFSPSGLVDLAFSICGQYPVMRFMTADAEPKLFAGLVRQAAMGAFVDLIQDIGVAVFTLFETEEVPKALVDIAGIWVRLLPCDLPMAFQAGDSAMGRNMESFRVNQPLRPGTLTAAQKDNRGEDEQTEITDAVVPDSFRQHVLQPRARGGR